MYPKTGIYPSDLSDEQWAFISALTCNKRSGSGREMSLELRAVVNAIFYVVRSGCAWRSLPKTYPYYNSVYYHYHKWCWDSTWERVNTAMR